MQDSIKEKVIDGIIEIEGGYVDDPSDSGGKTKYGITEAVARKEGYAGKMIDLPRSLAFDIYSVRYWDSVRASDIEKISSRVASEVVDSAVNIGVRGASKMLQRSLNALTNHNLVVDGIVGSRTIKALAEHIEHRKDDTVLMKALNCIQGEYYITLTEKRGKDKRFIYGWLNHRVKI